jgi:cytochrome c553
MDACDSFAMGRLMSTTRCSLLLVLIASIFAHGSIARAQDAERAPDTMAARVLACASCHGDRVPTTIISRDLLASRQATSTISWSRSGTGGANIRR